jgi:cyclic beta-1,2-glucan synthetase
LNERARRTQDLQIALESLVRTSNARPRIGGATEGGVFVLRADLISAEARGSVATARIVLHARRGTLHDQLRGQAPNATPPRRRLPPVDRGQSTQPPVRGC